MPRAERIATGDRVLAVLRAGTAVLLVVALVAQFVVGAARNGLTPVNFFSYYTVLSNAAAAVVLLARALPGKRARPGPALRGAVTLMMAVTGIVYAVLLAPIAADVGLTEPWVDVVLHVVGPVVVVLDWLVAPPRRAPTAGAVAVWFLPPAVYLGYSVARGARTGRYPYPFLDPAAVGGYPGVAGYVLLVLVVVAVLALLLRAWALRRARTAA